MERKNNTIILRISEEMRRGLEEEAKDTGKSISEVVRTILTEFSEEDMPSKDSITKTIRLNKDDKEAVERCMEIHGLSWSGAVHKLMNEGKYDMRPFERVCKRVGVNPEKMLSVVVRNLNEAAREREKRGGKGLEEL